MAGDFSALTRAVATDSNAIEIPSVELPRGGGALKGIDETFNVNAANGTSSLTIPLPLTPGRGGFTPELNLRYNSGGGNGPFGLGWSLDLPSIQRRTDRRLPRYREGREEDVYLLSGAEDLTPVLQETEPGVWEALEHQAGAYRVKRYRPRIESAFARIEQVRHADQGTYWKVTSKENVVTIYGRSPQTRIADPDDDRRVFQWLPEFSYDDKGNWMRYEYKDENLDNVPDEIFESKRREGLARFSNKYLKRVKYGNRRPYYADPARPYDPPAAADPEHFFELVFDYGEHNELIPLPQEDAELKWAYRADAFSTYRAGFEIRTKRLCQRALMFHHFSDEAAFGVDYLVRSLTLDYRPSSINESGQAEVSYLGTATQYGHIRRNDGSYSSRALPPLSFSYRELQWNTDVRTIDTDNIQGAAAGLTNNYQWVDVYGEGIAGILAEEGEGWFYKSNLGDRDDDGRPAFTAANKLIDKPSLNGLGDGRLSLQDLAADGRKQLVVNAPGLQGYFELGSEGEWQAFTPFREIANIDPADPNLRRIDLDGDGQAELVIAGDDAFIWYAANGRQGYQAAERSVKSLDEDSGPRIIFADQQQRVFLADMTGDGLTDIVRISNGEVCYWANKGYGCFSAKVRMGNAPLFDHPAAFNPQYIHLADVSGTGTTDIVYLGKRRFSAFLNLSGNALSNAHDIDPFCPVDTNSRLAVVDLLGTGTACVVWSSDLPTHAQAPMRYIDLMDGRKPHLMSGYTNSMGKECRLSYRSSTYFYLKDKREGRPWSTKLPFPVQVLSEYIVEDGVTNVRFSSRYRYHHGYYDQAEREFRGFAMVEQTDSEVYSQWHANAAGTRLEQSEELYQAPVLTKTWFHTGAFVDRQRILNQHAKEYWFEEYQRQLPDSPLTIGEAQLPEARIHSAASIAADDVLDRLSAAEWREMLRACKGMVIRKEVFALDAAVGASDEDVGRQLTPYTVEMRNCDIQLLQPRLDHRCAVFLLSESESLSYHYERKAEDPRVRHTLNIRVDDRGNVLERASISYGRKQAAAEASAQDLRDRVTDFNDSDEQAALQSAFAAALADCESAQRQTHVVVTRNSFSNDIDLPEAFRSRSIAEVRTYEISGLTSAAAIFTLSEFEEILSDARSAEIAYHETAGVGITRRLIECSRTLYYRADLMGALPLGQIDARGLQFEAYQLAYTPALLTALYGAAIADPETTMTDAGYVHSEADADWWIPSGRIDYIDQAAAEDATDAADRFFSAQYYIDPMGSPTGVTYYRDYFLMLESLQDALGNQSKVERFNLRSLSPRRIRDMNDNLSEVLLNELALPKAFALLGKDLDNDGLVELDAADSLVGLDERTDAESIAIQDFFATEDSTLLEQRGRALLQGATRRYLYDFTSFERGDGPVVVATIDREEHHNLNPASGLQMKFEYSDGFNKLAMSKMQAEPGSALRVDVDVDNSYTVVKVDTAAAVPPTLRWLGSGRSVLNNKGKPVKQYEPYFAVTPRYEDIGELVESGVASTMYYDSPGRLTKTLFPDNSFGRLEFDSWRQHRYDRNDTVADSRWYDDRVNNLIDAELLAADRDPLKEKEAAQQTALHYDTPAAVYLDSLGRPMLNIDHNGRDDMLREKLHLSFLDLDVEGNVRSIRDPRGTALMEYGYDMLGRRAYRNGADAGERRMLNNVIGNPVHTWDGRGHRYTYSYDALQRLSSIRVSGGDVPGQPLNNLVERIVYGEGQADDRAFNLRGQKFHHYDTGGRLVHSAYDLKGNLLASERRLTLDYRVLTDWTGPEPDSLLEAEAFAAQWEYDALGRQTRMTNYDGSITERTYNAAGLLERVRVTTALSPAADLVRAIDYDARGNRSRIEYGNGIVTQYRYDVATDRLLHLETRKADNELLQDWYYTYDPEGNISHLEDKSVPAVFFNNQKIEALARYSYDPQYRLIEATGREHAGQAIDFGQDDNWRDVPFRQAYQAGDPMAWRDYRQCYRHDPAGNIRRIEHKAGAGSWTRDFSYASDSNRLQESRVGARTYNYPTQAEHGNIEEMPHLQVMQWNFRDELTAVARQRVLSGTPETTYYVYDSTGRRLRKVTDKAAGEGHSPGRKEERIYLDGIELYRKHSGGNSGLERRTLEVGDDEGRIAFIETRNEVDDGSEQQLLRYQFSNIIGSVQMEADDDARVISYEEYHPYGSTAYQAVDADVKAAAKRYRFVGMERDDESGLNYHKARYYAPWLGRWLSPDPLGINGGLNLYEYAAANPINFRDQNGLQPTANQRRFREIHNQNGGNAAQTLISAFTDSQITDQRSGARGRFRTILNLTSSSSITPVHFNAHTIRGTGDSGFRREFRDSVEFHPDVNGADIPLHRSSSNQIGHFLTAAHMGFQVAGWRRTIEADRQFRRDHPILWALSRSGGGHGGGDPMASLYANISINFRAAIGHELVPDSAGSGSGGGATGAIAAASAADVANFENDRLDRIAINSSQAGNSYQDLYLTRVGFLFGQRVEEGFFANEAEAAEWLELMLVSPTLAYVPSTHKFYQDAQRVDALLQQFATTQPAPQAGPPAPP